MTMIERVARAFVESLRGDGAVVWEEDIAAARAAIKAMREPTDEMVDAVWSKPDVRGSQYPISGHRERYSAMIDAALNEEVDDG